MILAFFATTRGRGMLSQPTMLVATRGAETLGGVPGTLRLRTVVPSTWTTVGSDSVLRCKLVGHSNIKRYKLTRKQAAVFAIIAEHLFSRPLRARTPPDAEARARARPAGGRVLRATPETSAAR